MSIKSHHSLLHLEHFTKVQEGQAKTSLNGDKKNAEETLAALSSLLEPKGVFATAIIQDIDKFGKLVTIRVLVDTGADEFLNFQQNSSFHVKNAGQMYLEEFLSLLITCHGRKTNILNT